jgi:SAM-dependent methyltransferase
MSVEIPSPWAQSFPRSVRLGADGLLVPASTLRLHLGRGPVELTYAGSALVPWIDDGGTLYVESRRSVRPGDLALCEIEGWGDLRRVLSVRRDGVVVTALDAFPPGREAVPPSRILGAARGVRGAGDAWGILAARAFPLWSRLAAFLHWLRLVGEAPRFGRCAAESVREKYAQQVPGYARAIGTPADPVGLEIVRSRLARGGSVLIAGSGAGGEALALARDGYRVTGFDFVPAMVESSRTHARDAALEAEFVLADLVTLDLGSRRFDAVYVTPLVYSFVSGRAGRVEGLLRLARHLVPGGPVIFTAYLIKDPIACLEVLLAWMRRRPDCPAGDLGDWYTRFMTPQGTIGRSFVHRAFAWQVVREARAAGFGRVEMERGTHFVASGFRDLGAPPVRH